MLPLPILKEPAIKLGKILIVADLHIGFELELWRQGIKVPFQTEKLVRKLNDIISSQNLKKVIVNGDLKHEIAGFKGRQAVEIEKFFEGVEAEVEVIKGNHDGGLEIDMYPSSGIEVRGVGIFHGHAYPGEEILKAKYWIAAHLHPMFGFRDSYGKIYKEPCWIVGEVSKKFLREGFGEKRKIKIIVLPAFSSFVGGVSVNIEGISGILSKIIEKPKFFLLDGTEIIFEKLGS